MHYLPTLDLRETFALDNRSCQLAHLRLVERLARHMAGRQQRYIDHTSLQGIPRPRTLHAQLSAGLLHQPSKFFGCLGHQRVAHLAAGGGCLINLGLCLTPRS